MLCAQEEALARAHERAMERYVAARADAAWRPDLKQRVQDYHLGLLQHRGTDPHGSLPPPLPRDAVTFPFRYELRTPLRLPEKAGG